MNETTAQDASGATIVPWNDLKVAVFSRFARSSARVARLESTLATGRMTEPRTGKRLWTLPDRGRKERAHRSLENRGRFSTSAHRHHRVLIKKKKGSAHTWPATGLRQLPSSAAVASGAPLLTLRRQK